MHRLITTLTIIVFLSAVLGCSQAPVQTAPPASTVNYEFYDRGASSQADIEEMMGSVIAGYLIVDGDYPRSVLVNYIYRNKCAYFPLSTAAHQEFIKAIAANPKVCFAVDKYTQLNWWSANVFGKAEVITDKSTVNNWLAEYEKSLGKSGFNYSAANDTVIVRVMPELVSGRKMNDPQNPNFAPRLPWMTLRHGTGNTDVAARLLPAPATEATLAQTVSFNNADPKTVESILKGVGGCRFNILDAEYPYSIPMSVMAYKDGKVILHSNKKGQKMDCLKINNKTSLDYQWFWNNSQWISLYLEGHINIAETPEEIAKVLGMGAPQMFDKMAQRMAVLEFVPEKVIIRQIEIPLPWYPKMPGTRTE